MRSQPFAIPALLLFLVSIPLILELIPRNRFYGVRTVKTMSSDRVWYAVNRLVAVSLTIGSGIYGIVAVLLPYDRLANDNFVIWGIHLVAFIVPIIISLSLSFWFSRHL